MVREFGWIDRLILEYAKASAEDMKSPNGLDSFNYQMALVEALSNGVTGNSKNCSRLCRTENFISMLMYERKSSHDSISEIFGFKDNSLTVKASIMLLNVVAHSACK